MGMKGKERACILLIASKIKEIECFFADPAAH